MNNVFLYFAQSNMFLFYLRFVFLLQIYVGRYTRLIILVDTFIDKNNTGFEPDTYYRCQRAREYFSYN